MNVGLLKILRKYQELKKNLHTADEHQFLMSLNEIQTLSSAVHGFLKEEMFLSLGKEIKSNFETMMALAEENQLKLVVQDNNFLIKKSQELIPLILVSPEELAASLVSSELSPEALEMLELFCSEKQTLIALNFSLFLNSELLVS